MHLSYYDEGSNFFCHFLTSCMSLVCCMFMKEPEHLSGTTQYLFLHNLFSDTVWTVTLYRDQLKWENNYVWYMVWVILYCLAQGNFPAYACKDCGNIFQKLTVGTLLCKKVQIICSGRNCKHWGKWLISSFLKISHYHIAYVWQLQCHQGSKFKRRLSTDGSSKSGGFILN